MILVVETFECMGCHQSFQRINDGISGYINICYECMMKSEVRENSVPVVKQPKYISNKVKS